MCAPELFRPDGDRPRPAKLVPAIQRYQLMTSHRWRHWKQQRKADPFQLTNFAFSRTWNIVIQTERQTDRQTDTDKHTVTRTIGLIYGGSEQFLTSGCLHIRPNIFNSKKIRRRNRCHQPRRKEPREQFRSTSGAILRVHLNAGQHLGCLGAVTEQHLQTAISNNNSN